MNQDVPRRDKANGHQASAQEAGKSRLFRYLPEIYESSIESFLFSVGLEFQEDLEQGIFSDNLRQEFHSQSISLSHDISIAVVVEGKGWQIRDLSQNQNYTAKRENEALSIYCAFFRNFLQIFEDIQAPLGRQLDHLYAYFDPHLTPAELLPWLSAWLDVALDDNLTESQQRAHLSEAPEIYAWRGTAHALRLHLESSLDVSPTQIQIQDRHGSDFSDDLKPHHFRVTINMSATPPRDEIAQQLVRDRMVRIIQEGKPAQTVCELRIEWSQSEDKKEFIFL